MKFYKTQRTVKTRRILSKLILIIKLLLMRIHLGQLKINFNAKYKLITVY